ncbi:MAG: hypothetical protein OEZ31_05690 [Nitrospirota bacterium]|nr:hypothetical protein [Nitrospirota bacterium]MDH5768434.1 hypothetical protein [Nitrospirota bacterium]
MRSIEDRVAQLSRWRRIAGIFAVLFFIIFFISALDSCASRILQPLNLVHVLPGTFVVMNGPIGDDVKSVHELTYLSSSELITLKIEEVYREFYFGGCSWRGGLTVSPGIKPGEYKLAVGIKDRKDQKPVLVFVIRVHEDEQSYRSSFKSTIMLYTGIPNSWVMVSSLFLSILFIGTIYYLSTRRETLFLKIGVAEVFWVGKTVVGKTVKGYEIGFSLGTRHGIMPGSRLSLFNEKRQFVGTVEVHKATEIHSFATTGPECPVKPGYTVLKI